MPTEIVSSLIVTNLKDCLKAKGYKQFRYIWNRRIKGITHVIEIQDMRGAAADSATFTINMGVFVATALEVVWGKAEPKYVRDVDCIIDVRIGRLMPGGLDKWWRIDPSVNLDNLINEVTDAINIYSERFFDEMGNLDGIRRYMIEQGDETNSYKLRRIYLALIELMLGNVPRAKALVDSFKGDDGWRARAQMVNKYLQSNEWRKLAKPE